MGDQDRRIQVAIDGDATGGINALLGFSQTATRTIGEVNSSLGTLGGGLNSVIGTFGVLGGILAGGSAFKSIISETVSWNLETGKLARTLGDTTENASVMKVALHTLGIDQEVVSSAAMRMARTLNTNSEAFKQVGVDAEGMRKAGKSNTEIMMATIQALGEYKGGLDRNQAAMTIFSRSWGELQQLMKLTPAIMNEARETAERLHLVVGQEGVSSAVAYTRSLRELGLVQDSIKKQIGQEMIPALTSLGVAFGEVGVRIAQSLGNQMRDDLRWMSESKLAWQTFAQELGIIMDGGPLGKNWWTKEGRAEISAELKTQEQMYSYSMEKIAERYGNAIKAVSVNPNDNKKSWQGSAGTDPAQALFDKYLNQVGDLNKQLRGVNPDLSEMQRKFLDVDDTVSKLTREMPQYSATWDDFGAKMKGNISITERLKTATAGFKEEAKETEEVLKGMGSLQVFSQGLGGILGQKKEKQQSRFSLDNSRSPRKNFGADLLGSMPADQPGMSEEEKKENLKMTADFEAQKALIEGDSFAKQKKKIDDEEKLYLKTYATLGGSFAENEKRKTEVQQLAADQRAKIEQAEQQQKLQWASQGFGSMASIADSFYQLSGKKSKEAFEIGKAMKIGETIISTGSAAMKAYDAMADIPVVGPALGIAAAAAAIAAGAVQIQNISSATSSGGGSISSVGGSSAGSYNSASSQMVPQPVAQNTQQAPSLQLTINGAIGTKKWFEDNLPDILKDFSSRNVNTGVAYTS